jgi:hypothetical protein
MAVTILNQEIDNERGIYRIQHGSKVVYLTIMADVYDEDTMCRPYLLLPKLPALPQEDWTRMHISKDSSEQGTDAFNVVVTNDALPGVDTIWHSRCIEVLTLVPIESHRSSVYEVMYDGTPAFCKIATFDWQIPRMEREAWAYSVLDRIQREEPATAPLWPRVLGHVAEQGRVIGILLERLEGRCAAIKDLPACTAALRRLHDIGLVHGDVNRFNFVVNEQNGEVRMVDFEHAAAMDEETAKEELASLASELEGETGRGGPSRVII